MIEKDKDPLHIAIWGSHFSWDGGIDFLIYLMNGLNHIKEENEISLFLILPNDFVSELKYFLINSKNAVSKKQIPVFKKSNVNKRILSAVVNSGIKVQTIYYNYTEKDLIQKLKSINCSVLLPVVFALNKKFPFPWIGYIPDLQHITLPHFFSDVEIKFRDSRYKTLLQNAQSIIVNAKSVKNELAVSYGKTENIFNLSFLPPSINYNNEEEITKSLKEKYNLQNPYFIICNQFWKHKDHLTAFKAFNLLIKDVEFADLKLVCTGKMEDERFPEYIKELKDFIRTEQLENSIILLGFIPKQDQNFLMKNSVALIQPTLFEGGPGGGAVYSAISLGIRSLVSDIDVNAEIENNLITFFEVGNMVNLKKKMQEVLNTPFNVSDYSILEEEGNSRSQQLGKELMKIIETTIKEFKN